MVASIRGWFERVYARIGCKLYGHHPWVRTYIEPIEGTHQDDYGTIYRVTTSYEGCKRCGDAVVDAVPQVAELQICPEVEFEVKPTVNIKARILEKTPGIPGVDD